MIKYVMRPSAQNLRVQIYVDQREIILVRVIIKGGLLRSCVVSTLGFKISEIFLAMYSRSIGLVGPPPQWNYHLCSQMKQCRCIPELRLKWK